MERDLTDNELIAQFYGAEFIRKEDQFRPGKFIEQWIIKGNPFNQYRDQETKYWYPKELLLYHESWSWLMPVVEKISKIPTGDDDFFYPRTFGMRDADGNFIFRFNRHPLYTAKSLIEVTHAAVVEFIQWYNQNRKQ